MHALLGANGMLARIVCGLTAPDAGRMTAPTATPRRPTSKRDAERAGVHIIHQELRALDTLSVAESLFLDGCQIDGEWSIGRMH